MLDPVVVLKFGSSVLDDHAALPAVALEIYREVRAGRRVVAVVSAFGSTTDNLLADARARYGEPDPECLARSLETGELASAAELGLTLSRCGVPAVILDASQLDLRTSAEPLDAVPLGFDAGRVRRELECVPVVVVPGFSGRCQGKPTLLGRGGSDLTALFLADGLHAAECRLLKDVDGLLRIRTGGGLDHGTRYATAGWATCVRVGAPLVQSKAVEFARSRGLAFGIAACGSTGGTVVGAEPDRFEPVPECRPMRVALAGLGTVGLGVYRWLAVLPRDFEVVGVLVRRRIRDHPADVPVDLLCYGVGDLLERSPDLVIEVMGGTNAAADLVTAARAGGLPCVTANKQLLAERPELLAEVRASASVGGSVPVLECMRALAASESIVGIEGIINGTCNFLLDQMMAGIPWADALEEARRRGLAEADPHLDVSGLDCVHKLVVLAATVFGQTIAPQAVAVAGLDGATPERLAGTRDRGCELKLVARLVRDGETLRASVGLAEIAPRHGLARCPGVRNRTVATTACGDEIVLDGTGAGRWPTTVSVVSDAFAARRESARPAKTRCSA
ncbi:MAG: homoserine dehydrogenase [bacterium]|nr:homoserine dehydrogenase [bacterium]